MKLRYKLLVLPLLMLFSGCGMVAIMASENSAVKDGFDLTEYSDSKVAILVDQPVWMGNENNMRYLMTESTRQRLMSKLRFKADQVLEYSDVARMRSERSDFARLTPVQIGQELGSDFVIFVTITKYGLYELSEEGYYSGSLQYEFMLFDVNRGCKVWPDEEGGKKIKIKVEVCSGKEKTNTKLAMAGAHCVVRDFHKCPLRHYKILEEDVNYELNNW